jgi:hypothetical protein
MDVWEFWARLGTVGGLRFEARSRTGSGWDGQGQGTVKVERIDPRTLVFHERGTWTPERGRELPFTNVFRWSVSPDGDSVRLEHLRFGAENPVLLFDLVPVAGDVLEAAEPHACSEDRYWARMVYDRDAIRLNWTITGPKKDEAITYLYR